METSLEIPVHLQTHGVCLGIVQAFGCAVGPTPAALDEEIRAAVQLAASTPEGHPLQGAVRNLLRFGSYKPTGRAKPASEYLLKAASEQRFPSINNLVDINNWLSLISGLPISLLDLELAAAQSFNLRRGRAGESFVFNSAGHVIELEDLLLIAAEPGDRPCANPVKDAMATKVHAATTDVMAVLYGPWDAEASVADITQKMAFALAQYGGAHSAHPCVLRGKPLARA